jgi:hypothetical protein
MSLARVQSKDRPKPPSQGTGPGVCPGVCLDCQCPSDKLRETYAQKITSVIQ